VRRTKPDGTQGDRSRGGSCGRATRQNWHVAPSDRVISRQGTFAIQATRFGRSKAQLRPTSLYFCNLE
jgi:hypothetical protein